MRRAILAAALAGGVLIATPLPPAAACHFGGIGCGAPENQPFDPRPSVTLADNRTSAHSNLTYGFTQQAHEQFVIRLAVDFAPSFGIDLDKPALDERIADVSLRAIISGAQTTLNGRIFDHNGHGLPAHPAGGVYHWLIEIDSPTPGMPPSTFDAFADRAAPDGHFHFEFEVSADLLANAMAVDASVLEVTATFFGTVAAGPFLTNPATPGSHSVTSSFTAWDDPATPQTPPTATRTASVTVAARVPTSVTVSPANATKRVGETHTPTATVLDQRNEALVGALVDFDVSAGAHAGSQKCQDVVTGADGKGACSYTETTGGQDTLRATATAGGGSASGTATVRWRAPTTLTLTPETSTNRLGETLTLTATITDQDGSPMQGESVTFTRTGANPGSATAATDANGRATHAYAGANEGADQIVASSSALSDSASTTWYVPVVTTLSLSPATATRAIGSTHTVTATALDQHGRAVAGVGVSFSVTDGPHAGTTGSGATDAAGQASFSYTGSAEGTDTIQATAGAESATASVTWSSQPQPTPEDHDGDGIRNTDDNCSFVFNPDQADADGDHFGDACDGDDDNDSLQDGEEAPNGCNPFARDTDGDGLTDWQEVKGYRTPCNDADADDDGASDGAEILQMGTDPRNPDTDGDGVADGTDNCPRIANADQRDSDGDGKGDACDGLEICVSTDPARCPQGPISGP